MGVAFHELACLCYLAREAPLGDVVTVGRHWLLVDSEKVERLVGNTVSPSTFAEPVILALGATSVQAVDASGYEGAQIVADLSAPQQGLPQFDLIADFGSLEHIFDVPTALRNVASMCRAGGRIAHVLPANNLSGHGFWQFGSDLFFEFYSAQNGFQDTEVYFASGVNETRWHRARRAAPGERFEFASMEPIMVICITTKVRETEMTSQLSQPFYSRAWELNSSDHLANDIAVHEQRGGRGRRFIKNFPLAYRIARNLYTVLGLAAGRSSYSLKKLEVVPIQTLVSKRR